MSPPRSGPSRRARRLRRRIRRAGARASLPLKELRLRGALPGGPVAGPDFLIIGAQKAGTTWLAENLDAHPEISLARRSRGSDRTEIRYFDQQLHRSLRWYESHFRDLPGRLKGEKSPNYYALPADRVRLIGRVLPGARILFLLRDPRERAWSHALMNLVTLPGVPFEDVPERRFRAHFRRTLERGLYSDALDRWGEVYPAERVHVGFFEDVVARPQGLLEEILGFLGAAPETDWSAYPFARRINRGPGISPPEGLRADLEALYRDEIARLRERFGGAVKRWARRSP